MKILILGIGNPGRGDDGLGPALVARLSDAETAEWAEASTFAVLDGKATAAWKYQLNVEDADTIKDFEVVMFVDASAVGDEPVVLTPLLPAKSITFSTHEMSPASVLALAEELYGRAPKGHLLAIRGYAWEMGEGLSERARQNLASAAALLKEALGANLAR